MSQAPLVNRDLCDENDTPRLGQIVADKVTGQRGLVVGVQDDGISALVGYDMPPRWFDLDEVEIVPADAGGPIT